MPILDVLRKLRNSAVERVALETMKEEDEMWCQDELPHGWRNNLKLTSSMPRTVKIMLPSVESVNEESCGACELNAIADLNQSKSVHIELSNNALHYIRVASLALDEGSIDENHFTPNGGAKRQRLDDSDRVVLESPNVKADYRRRSLFITYLDADGRPHMRRERTRITKTAFGELESRMGFHFSEHAVVNDTALNYRSISTLNFDWVHIYFSSGLFTREIEAFVAKARELAGKGKPALVSYADLHDYLQLWHVPACWASCKTIFVKGSMAATASEQLSAAPLLRNFFENVVMREPSLSQLHEAARSAALVCAAVEKLQCATRKLVGRPELRQAICDHLARHQRVHGTEWWTLKDHLALHLPDQEELFDTFVTERRHKDPKRFARLALRTSMKGYNKGLMEELVCQHFHNWNQFRPEDALVAPHAVPKRLQGPLRDIFPTAYNIQISQQFRGADGRKIHAGDVALLGAARGHSCCKIWCHVNVDGVPRGLVWNCGHKGRSGPDVRNIGSRRPQPFCPQRISRRAFRIC